jgi:sucrose-6-phosphatase
MQIADRIKSRYTQIAAVARPRSSHRQFLCWRHTTSFAMHHRFCIVSDLDHTMVDHEDPKYTSLLDFNRIWSSKFRHDSYLVFSTGRSHVAFENLRKEAPLLTPDLLICSVGTEIYIRTEGGEEVDAEWNAELDKGWNRDKIVSTVKSEFDKLTPQSDSEQRPHKVSYHLKAEDVDKKAYVQQLRDKLHGSGLKVKVVYSGGIDVDVLPECASKGLALQFLQVRERSQLEWATSRACVRILYI